MSYAALGAENWQAAAESEATAEGSAQLGVPKGCIDIAKGQDYETKAGREEAAKDIAECAADAACALEGIPPGICGPAARYVIAPLIDIWNGWFGNQEEWDAYYQQKAETAAYFARMAQVADAENEMVQALNLVTVRLIEAHDKLRSALKGRLGGPKKRSWELRGFGSRSLPTEQYEYDTDARLLLARHGLPLVTHTALRDPRGRLLWLPPRIFARFQERCRGDAVAKAACGANLVRLIVPPWLTKLRAAAARAEAEIVALAAADQAAAKATAKARAARAAGAKRGAAFRKKAIAQREAYAARRAAFSTRTLVGASVLLLGGAGAWWVYRSRKG